VNRTVLKTLSLGTLLALASTVSCSTDVEDDAVTREGEQEGEAVEGKTSDDLDGLAAPDEDAPGEPGEPDDVAGRPPVPQHAEPPTDDASSCPDGLAVVLGTAGPDVKFAQPDQCIVTASGSDVVFDSAEGDGAILAGDDNDNIFASGPSLVAAGAGNDAISASGPGLELYGQDGVDTINATSADGAIVSGGPGDDNMNNVTGADVTVTGDDGDDTINVVGAGSIVRGGNGDDDLNVTGDGATVEGNIGDDILNVSGSNTTVIPGPGLDTVNVSGSGTTVKILDLCEVTAGETLNGSNSTLVSPVSIAELQSLGVTVNGFENVVIETNTTGSQCGRCDCVMDSTIGARSCCAARGSCDSARIDADEIECACVAGATGPGCNANEDEDIDTADVVICDPAVQTCPPVADHICRNRMVQFPAGIVQEQCGDLASDLPADDRDLVITLRRGWAFFPSDDYCGQNLDLAPFPLFVFEHGNGQSATEYEELMSAMAAAGFFAVSVDTPATIQGDPQVAGTAEIRRRILECYTRLITSDVNPSISDNLDKSRVAIGGHSSGGEAAQLLAERIESENVLPDLNVRAVTSIAPSFVEQPGITGSGIDGFLSLLGSTDGDIGADGQAFLAYENAGTESFGFPEVTKALVYVFRIPHASWGGAPYPGSGRQIAADYIRSFLEWQVLGEPAGRAPFADYVLPASAPDETFVQYSEGTPGSRIVVDDFEDADDNTNSLGGAIALASGDPDFQVADIETSFGPVPAGPEFLTRGMSVTWSGTDDAIEFSFAQLDLSQFNVLSLRVGKPFVKSPAACEPESPGPIDFSVVLMDQSKEASIAVSDHDAAAGIVDPDPRPGTFGLSCHTTDFFQTIRIPLGEFCAVTNGFQIDKVEGVKLAFDRQAGGMAIVDSIEFSTRAEDGPPGCP